MKKEKDTQEGLQSLQSLTPKKELRFRCPRCGGDTLSRGEKNYLKVTIFEDGELIWYGGDNLDEDQFDFACYKCGLIICQGEEPIRTDEDMTAWLKANCEQED
jgi:predicted RNA-binding Zn-ribbon protein involved in translation (DUF1610 family)